MQSPRAAALTAKRNLALKQFMSKPVLDTLRMNGIALTDAQQAWLCQQFQHTYRNHPNNEIDVAKLKKVKAVHPYTPWIVHDVPYISLPTPPEQRPENQKNPKKQRRAIFSKRMINLLDGSTMRDKVFRPISTHSSTFQMYQRWWLAEANNLQLAKKTPIKLTRSKSFGPHSSPVHHLLYDEAKGENLWHWDLTHSLSGEEVLWIFKELCSITYVLHNEIKQVHFDIKHENIIFNREPRLLALIDWEGMAPIRSWRSEPIFTESYAHPQLLQAKNEAAEKGTDFVVLADPKYDVYGIVFTMHNLFKHLMQKVAPKTPLHDYLYSIEYMLSGQLKNPSDALITLDILMSWVDTRIAAYPTTLQKHEEALKAMEQRSEPSNTLAFPALMFGDPQEHPKTQEPMRLIEQLPVTPPPPVSLVLSFSTPPSPARATRKEKLRCCALL